MPSLRTSQNLRSQAGAASEVADAAHLSVTVARILGHELPNTLIAGGRLRNENFRFVLGVYAAG